MKSREGLCPYCNHDMTEDIMATLQDVDESTVCQQCGHCGATIMWTVAMVFTLQPVTICAPGVDIVGWTEHHPCSSCIRQDDSPCDGASHETPPVTHNTPF